MSDQFTDAASCTEPGYVTESWITIGYRDDGDGKLNSWQCCVHIVADLPVWDGDSCRPFTVIGYGESPDKARKDAMQSLKTFRSRVSTAREMLREQPVPERSRQRYIGEKP